LERKGSDKVVLILASIQDTKERIQMQAMDPKNGHRQVSSSHQKTHWETHQQECWDKNVEMGRKDSTKQSKTIPKKRRQFIELRVYREDHNFWKAPLSLTDPFVNT
jgi:hypothetical protein